MSRRRRPLRVIAIQESPLETAQAEYAEARLQANLAPEIRRPVPREGTDMTNPPPAVAAEIRNYVESVVETAVERKIKLLSDVLQEAFDGQNAVINRFSAEVAELSERLDSLPKNGNDISDRLVHFLESHPGTKFSPTSVSENLDLSGHRVSERLRSLASSGRISVKAEPGRRPLYFVNG